MFPPFPSRPGPEVTPAREFKTPSQPMYYQGSPARDPDLRKAALEVVCAVEHFLSGAAGGPARMDKAVDALKEALAK